MVCRIFLPFLFSVCSSSCAFRSTRIVFVFLCSRVFFQDLTCPPFAVLLPYLFFCFFWNDHDFLSPRKKSLSPLSPRYTRGGTGLFSMPFVLFSFSIPPQMRMVFVPCGFCVPHVCLRISFFRFCGFCGLFALLCFFFPRFTVCGCPHTLFSCSLFLGALLFYHADLASSILGFCF